MRTFPYFVLFVVACGRAEPPSDAPNPSVDDGTSASVGPCPISAQLGPLASVRLAEDGAFFEPLEDGGTVFRHMNIQIVTPALPGRSSEWYLSETTIFNTNGEIVSYVNAPFVSHFEIYSYIGDDSAVVPASTVDFDAPLITEQRYNIEIVVRHKVHTQCHWSISVRDVGLVHWRSDPWVWGMQSPTFMAANPGYPYAEPERSPPDDGGGTGHDTAARDSRR